MNSSLSMYISILELPVDKFFCADLKLVYKYSVDMTHRPRDSWDEIEAHLATVFERGAYIAFPVFYNCVPGSNMWVREFLAPSCEVHFKHASDAVRFKLMFG